MGMTTEQRARPAGRSARRGPSPSPRSTLSSSSIPASVPAMANLMFDPRVVRGNTFSRIKGGCSPMPPDRKPPERKKPRRGPVCSTTPPSVDGRKHMDIQTDVYLEELVDTIPEYDVDTQTDPFLDRPATPLFIPQKPGPDVGTQIEEGDLFNFDEEVEPMVEVLVGRTVEQAWMEVTEERQLAELHKHQDHFERIRAAELVATQRMEFSEWRKVEEKKRRVEQEKRRLEEERRLRELVETQNYAREYLKKMTDSVFAYLDSEHYFYDPVEREVENQFMPWLEYDIQAELDQIYTSRNALHCLVEAATAVKESRALGTVSEIMSKIVMHVEAHMEELASLDSEDCVREVMDVVEQNALSYGGWLSQFTPDFLEYFESVEFHITCAVRNILNNVIERQAAEERVKAEVHRILQRVVEENLNVNFEAPAPPEAAAAPAEAPPAE